mgnify:CR=1 FL=1
MKKLTKLTALLLVVATMLFSFAACINDGDKDNNNDGDDKVKDTLREQLDKYMEENRKD